MKIRLGRAVGTVLVAVGTPLITAHMDEFILSKSRGFPANQALRAATERFLLGAATFAGGLLLLGCDARWRTDTSSWPGRYPLATCAAVTLLGAATLVTYWEPLVRVLDTGFEYARVPYEEYVRRIVSLAGVAFIGLGVWGALPPPDDIRQDETTKTRR